MFQIDRSYIDSVDLESLQSRIWDIRTDHRADPTLPRIENYGTNEDAFEAYLEKKQHFLDFKDSWRKRSFLIMGAVFLVIIALFSLFTRGLIWEPYAVALMVCMLIFMAYKTIVAFRARKFSNNPNETFIKALLFWDEHKDANG